MAKTTKEEGKERTTMFVRPSLIKKLDYIVSKEHIDTGIKLSRTDKINEALEDYVARFEKKHGPIIVK